MLFNLDIILKSCWFHVLVFVALGHSVSAQWMLSEPDPEILAYTNLFGQGVSLVDFNLDGWDDLTLANASGGLDFFTGGPDGFQEVDLGITPSTGRPIALFWLDIDNDGDRDFLHTAGMELSAFSGFGEESKSQLWINEGGSFIDRSEEWGWDILTNRHALGMAFCDMDVDGDLDVMVSIYSLPCEDIWMSENVLLGHEDGVFVDMSVYSGIADGSRPTFQGVWLHLNDDALLDLFVIDDAGIQGDCGEPETNRAYINSGDGTFIESADLIGLDVSMASMSITVGDPDQDGMEEIFVTNQQVDDYYPHSQLTAGFFDRHVSGQWLEVSSLVGVDATRWSWGAMWVDQDLDGAEELMIATNPFIFEGSPNEVEVYDNYLYRQILPESGGILEFEEDTSDWEGRDRPMYCIARGDVDCDGDPDGVGLGTGPFATVWLNQVESTHPEHGGITVSVCGSYSNSEAIGTKMVLHSPGRRQQRTLRAGEDLYVQHSTAQFFGLATSQAADSLEIFWPDGTREVHHDLVVDSAYRFVEAANEVQVEFGQAQGDSLELHLVVPPKWTGVQWNGDDLNGLNRWVVIGEPVFGSVFWFYGLFSVPFAVNWSEYSSEYSGCTVAVADNFDPAAIEDDGSCTYQTFCGTGTVWSQADEQCIAVDLSCPPDVDGDGLVGVADVLVVLSYFGEPCSIAGD